MQQKYHFNEVFASERKLLSEFLYYIKVNLAIMKISCKSHENPHFSWLNHHLPLLPRPEGCTGSVAVTV